MLLGFSKFYFLVFLLYFNTFIAPWVSSALKPKTLRLDFVCFIRPVVFFFVINGFDNFDTRIFLKSFLKQSDFEIVSSPNFSDSGFIF